MGYKFVSLRTMEVFSPKVSISLETGVPDIYQPPKPHRVTSRYFASWLEGNERVSFKKEFC